MIATLGMELHTTSGQYTYITTNSVGCDSATLELTILESTTSLTTRSECVNYTWNGTTYTSSGQYTYSTTNAAGCDSTATLDLTVLVPSNSYTAHSECELHMERNDLHKLRHLRLCINQSGCDLLLLGLTILEPTTSLTTLTECDSYLWNGSTYLRLGFILGQSNAVGCDSVAVWI